MMKLSTNRRPGLLILATGLLAAAFCVDVHADPLLAYTKDRIIYTASLADGKNAKKICAGDEPCISNNGRWIVYTQAVEEPHKGKHADPLAGPGSRAMVVRELATGKETTLPAGGATQAYGGLWSPDDQWIAFNALVNATWQVVVAHPEGAGFRVLGAQPGEKSRERFLAGWNQHDRAVLTQDFALMYQLDPGTGSTAWQRPVKEITGYDSNGSDLRCTIAADGKTVVSTREVEKDEIKHLDGPSSYLVRTELPGVTQHRITPVKFSASDPWLDATGESVLLRGFGAGDVTVIKGSGGVRLKTRIYRCELRTGKLTPLVEGGESPSASRE